MPHKINMDNHKEKFEHSLMERTKAITRAKGEKIIKFLSQRYNSEDFSPRFKHWAEGSSSSLCSRPSVLAKM